MTNRTRAPKPEAPRTTLAHAIVARPQRLRADETITRVTLALAPAARWYARHTR